MNTEMVAPSAENHNPRASALSRLHELVRTRGGEYGTFIAVEYPNTDLDLLGIVEGTTNVWAKPASGNVYCCHEMDAVNWLRIIAEQDALEVTPCA